MEIDRIDRKISIPEQIATDLFKTLNLVGCNPMNRTFRQNILWTIHFCLQIFWCLVVSGYNICCYEGIPGYIEHIMYTVIVFQVVIKFAICRIFANNLSTNLKTLFYVFWTDENIVDTGRESYLKLNKYLNFVIIGYKKLFIYCIIIVAAETMYSTPFRPVTTVWTPKSIDINYVQPYAFLLYIGQILSVAGCVILAIVPLDSIYILLIGSAYIQFDCMISTIKHADCSDKLIAYNTLTKCVEHHNLVIEFLKKVEEVYTLSLLSQLSAILFTICLAIYMSTLDENLTLRPYLYALLSAAQLIIYCLGGQLITDQGLSLADAAFECKWWQLPDKAFRNGLILMIQRSHRAIHISAGNVFILSIELFTKVLKASVSFMTMLKTTTSKD